MAGRGRSLHSGVVWVLAVFSVFAPIIALASIDETAGTASATFLEIPVGAQALVVPDVVAAMRPDGAILFSNPSGLGDIHGSEVYFTTANWLDEFNLSAASAVIPLRRYGLTWSAGARLLYAGDVQGYDATGVVVADESYYDLALSTGIGRRFERLGLALGVGATYLREHLAVEDGNAFTVSLGASYTFRRHRFDVIGRDLGGHLKFDDRSFKIEERLIVGYGYQFIQQWGALSLGSQVTVARGGINRLDAGVSFDPNRYLTLRSGVGHSSSKTDEGDLPLTAGFGFHFGDASLDYAFTPRQYFGDTHMFSLRFVFAGGRRAELLPLESTAPVFSSSPAALPAGTRAPLSSDGDVFLIVGGTHSRMESAEAEVRALELLKIPATAEALADQFRVVINRFSDRDDAVSALRKLRYQGRQFAIVIEKAGF